VRIDVRQASNAGEFERFRALATEYEASLPDDLKHADFPEQYADIAAHYGPPHAAFVADADGTPAGCVALTVHAAERVAVLKKMYVVPAYRKRGVARVLLGALIEYARKLDLHRVVLDTARERMQAAYTLYCALGFRECEPYGDVDYRCATFMELRIES
jgi:GNAT superfamily N-acetyltransferase